MNNANKTRQDAFERVVNAKMGSFVDASDEFLMSLNARVLEWSTEIARELARRVKAYEAAKAAREEEEPMDESWRTRDEDY